jgi:hypothetical protein
VICSWWWRGGFSEKLIEKRFVLEGCILKCSCKGLWGDGQVYGFKTFLLKGQSVIGQLQLKLCDDAFGDGGCEGVLIY